jgi:hypothetical protein
MVWRSPKRAPGNVVVHVPQTGRSVELRVGQQLEVNSGKVQEGYRAPPAAAAPAPAAASEPDESALRSARRPGRERELLRDLLREIEGPAPERTEQPAPSKG